MIACLVALFMRMRWEDVLAFIAGPVFLLVIIMGANQALKDGSSTEDSRQAGAPSEALPQTGSPQEPAGWMDLILPLAFLIVVMIVFANRRTIAFEMDAYLKRMATHKPRVNKAHARSAKDAEMHGTLYYETAIRLGAMIAASEGQTGPQSLAVLKRVYNLSDSIYPHTEETYEDALDHPQKMSQITKPFVAEYGPGATSSETLIFGMCSVAMANGSITERTLGLIRMTGDALGLLPGATARLLMSAGYFGNANPSGGQHGYTHSPSRSGSPTARLKHLHTLGLTGDADRAKIKKTWRHLATRYHPDKLASQNLPADELEKAESLMQSINEAYAWLKENA